MCAAQPAVVTDLESAVREHARIVRDVAADLVVFPELSLTGYILDAEPVDMLGTQTFADLVDACTVWDSTALVGAPIRDRGQDHIATLRVDRTGATVAYRKCHLGAEEAARFRPGPAPVTVDVHGWRVGLGICKDTGVEQHVAAMAALDMDLYACGVVHHRTEVDEQMRRATHMVRRWAVPGGDGEPRGADGARLRRHRRQLRDRGCDRDVGHPGGRRTRHDDHRVADAPVRHLVRDPDAADGPCRPPDGPGCPTDGGAFRRSCGAGQAGRGRRRGARGRRGRRR